MTTPLIFITSYAIKEGELERFRQFVRGLLEVLEADAPNALAINAYLNADGTEAAIVQLMPDADSIKHYWRVVHQQTGRMLGRLVENPTSVQIYGSPGDVMLEPTRHSAGSGVIVSVMAEHVGGFTRLAPQRS